MSDIEGAGKVETWTEVRLVGQPPDGYPQYDFTFRSNHPYAESLPKLLRRAEGWTDVAATTRTVTVVRVETEWVPYEEEP